MPAGPAPTMTTPGSRESRLQGVVGLWQVRRLWASRHSKQIPMPQRGPLGSPVTDWRRVRLVMVGEVPSGGVPFAGDFGGSAHDFVGD